MGDERQVVRAESTLRSIRFGAFELDVRAGELRKDGAKTHLQEQPYQLLLMLLEKPGEAVLREEIRKRLWPNDTIVEFGPSINAAIQRLRDALGDSADEPRYVETVARRGYRFIGQLDREEPAAERPPVPINDSVPDLSNLSGRTISHYRVYEKLGTGGMAEVYRARDTKLGRDVALKVLPEEFARNADRMARFEREALVLASLNHPNIATIYGVEESDGVRALVMELVEGPTLAERIGGRAMPLAEALKIAQQIADALEYSHEKGIIHRDLKPANVKLTAGGDVKLLDFGLAKALGEPAAATNNLSVSPTLTFDESLAGGTIGTAAYMAPEQARGSALDKRADIWAFGVVLYEMLTGRQPFGGATVSDGLADVLTKQPDLDRVPPRAQRLLRQCLEKDPKRRLRDIGDAMPLLEGTTEAVPAPRSSWWWKIAAGVLTVIAVIALWALWGATRPVERPLVRLDVDLGPEVALPPLGRAPGNVALSSDGTRLVFFSGNPARLYTRRLDQSKSNELPGTEGATRPFFSPDGRWVGFFTLNKLNKISVEGGAAVLLADQLLGVGGSWGADGNIIVGEQFFTGLVRVPASGGAPTTVLERAPGEFRYEFPQILPGGKAVLFVAYRTLDPNTASIELFSFADRRRKTLVHGSTFARYLPSGHLVYTNKGTLFAIPFDVDRLETRGTAVPVLDDVAYDAQLGDVDVDFAETGTLVYRRGGGGGGPQMVTVQWVNEAGKKVPLRAKPGLYSFLRLSPDGRRVALEVREGEGQDVWVYDPERDAMTRLTFGGLHASPTWSPDGEYVAYSAFGKGIYLTRADGSGQPQPLTQSKNLQYPWSFTPDGKRLAYYEFLGNPQIWTLPLEDQGGQLKAGKPEQFLQNQSSDIEPAFSPDGHWLAYSSNESGKYEVYVRTFPQPASGQGRKWQISNNGGTAPLWWRTSRELVYLVGDQLMVVNYSVNADSFVAEKPGSWIEIEKLDGAAYDLAADGKRVAVLTSAHIPEAPKPEREVTFLFNFFDELRRRVPVGR